MTWGPTHVATLESDPLFPCPKPQTLWSRQFRAWNQTALGLSPGWGTLRRPQRYFPSVQCHYLDQPTSGGAAQASAMTQVRARPMMAWFSPKRKLLMGLHTTTYRSMARTTKDHRAISPAMQSAISQHATNLDPTSI